MKKRLKSCTVLNVVLISDIRYNTEKGKAIEFEEEERALINSDKRCPDGQSYQFGSCREEE